MPKIITGTIPRIVTKTHWEKICQMVREGNGKHKISKALSLKINTAVDYIRMFKRGEEPSWPKRTGFQTNKTLNYVELFLSERNIRRQHTIKAYTQCARHFGEYLDKNKIALEDVVREDFIKMMEHFKNASTRKLYTIFYKEFFAWLCYQACRITHNPTETLLVPKQGKFPIQIFSDDEIRHMYAVCQTPLERILVSLYIYTGLRRSEVHAIELSHMDLERKLLYVPYAKGGKRITKPLPPKLVSDIREYLSSTTIRCGYLLVNPDIYKTKRLRGQHLSIDYLQKTMDAVFDRAFADNPDRRKQVSIHKFRHTYVTMNARNVQGSLAERRAFIAHMGWTDEKMLEKYLHIEEDSTNLATGHVEKTFEGKEWG